MPSDDPARPAPLVEPAASLPPERLRRAQRQLPLPGFGETAQARLHAARVLVIGAGGLGSASVPYLAGAGVGTIGIVDDDEVELSNLHRQIAHGTADLGRPKTASLADAVNRLDPGARVEQHRIRLDSSNALELFERYDLVIDGSDNFATRYLANDAAELTGRPLVWGAILQYHGQLGVAWHRYGPGYRDLFPSPPPPDDVMDCGTGGVLPGLCGTIGSLLATEALKLITGLGESLIGRVLLYDALAASFRELPYRRDSQASPVSELVDYERFCDGADPLPAAVSAEVLASELATGNPPRLLDVRTPSEHAARRIVGSTAAPLDQLESENAALGIATGPGPVTVYCERDPRSIRAARLLAERGVEVRYLRGGVTALAAVAPQLLEGHDV
ncbi:ThiF family adenylyltransferase [Leucobacter tenebrionis]|uniref:ThiF family adenylyltransferase n=1 Tax=Leucobacter tenebrionis TaxID=2873270 RepID=UPI001CA700A1|nr:ThiF family adenylyltransferase [Leucobacter tenebrionis]QZY52825.1 ThiF family adenylyltransferase [Leucobacter tenebrionis]